MEKENKDRLSAFAFGCIVTYVIGIILGWWEPEPFWYDQWP